MNELEKKEIVEQLNKIKEKKKKERDRKHGLHIVLYCFLALILFMSFGYLIYNVVFAKDSINQQFLIINSFLLVILVILFSITLLLKKEHVRIMTSIFTSIIFILFFAFNILVSMDKIKMPTKEVLENFVGKNITEVLQWASKHDITVNQVYEFSDHVEEYIIMAQDQNPNTLLSKIKEITFTVSEGPNLDKEIILADMTGWKIDDVLKAIEEAHLSNVIIHYIEKKEIEKDVVISQSRKGEMRRNEAITFTISLGDKSALGPVVMDNLVNQSEFLATLFLKRNGLTYKLEYQFSDEVEKGYVLSQSVKEGVTVTPNKDFITLIISKGKKISAPDFTKMSIDEATKWIIEQKMKVKFEEKYSATIEKGKIISASVKENDPIEVGSVIIITTSKGALKMEKFSSLNEFRSWAETNQIKFEEKYDYNSDVPKGSIIKFSKNQNDVILENDIIIVYISKGKPITVPNFVGKSKSAIQSSCNSLGLSCGFYYTGYSNTTKDVAVSQNIRSGSEVVSGTYINIGLSSGPAKSFTVYIQPTWYGTTADQTISNLKSKLASAAPGVTFNYVKKSANSGFPGQIHPDSPTKGGNNTFTQGKSYTIWVIQ